MSGKLDKSLDDIVSHRRSVKSGRGGRRVGSRKAVAGGISKNSKAVQSTRPTRATVVAPTAPAAATAVESKILVSGLPQDVTESQIKEYFGETVGPVKRVFLTYGPNGASRGIATIFFTRPQSAALAATKLNGVKIDNRPMKIEVIVNSQAVAALKPKGLGERIVQTNVPPKSAAAKNKPKSAAAAATTNSKATRGRPAKRGGRTGRGKPKTADELDAEMTDYFVPKTNGAAAETGDATMDDQIM